MAEFLPSNGISLERESIGVNSSSPASLYIDPVRVFVVDISSSYHKKSRTMLFSYGNMVVLQDANIYGLTFNFSADTLTISTTTGGTYGLAIKKLSF